MPPTEPEEQNGEQTTEDWQERLLRLTSTAARHCLVRGEGELVVVAALQLWVQEYAPKAHGTVRGR